MGVSRRLYDLIDSNYDIRREKCGDMATFLLHSAKSVTRLQRSAWVHGYLNVILFIKLLADSNNEILG